MAVLVTKFLKELLLIQQNYCATQNIMDIKIETLNLCQGQQLKNNLTKETIMLEKIDFLCMQETDINCNLDHNLLSFPGYGIETENNLETSRTAVYISNGVQYVRRGTWREPTQIWWS